MQNVRRVLTGTDWEWTWFLLFKLWLVDTLKHKHQPELSMNDEYTIMTQMVDVFLLSFYLLAKGWFCKFLLFIYRKCEISQFSLLMRNCREYYLINFNFKRVQFSCFLWNCLCSLGNANFWYTKSRNLRNHPLVQQNFGK